MVGQGSEGLCRLGFNGGPFSSIMYCEMTTLVSGVTGVLRF